MGGMMKPTSNLSLFDHFWSRVDRTDNGGCWPWLGSQDFEGYGRVQFDRKTFKAHRMAYELTYGRLDSGILVQHSCDNPICCQPKHLVPGTNTTNQEDKLLKGRQTAGERNSRAKITRQQAEEIRRLYALGGYTQQALGQRFGLAQASVKDIIARHTWR
jgi:hypothetical protein